MDRRRLGRPSPPRSKTSASTSRGRGATVREAGQPQKKKRTDALILSYADAASRHLARPSLASWWNGGKSMCGQPGQGNVLDQGYFSVKARQDLDHTGEARRPRADGSNRMRARLPALGAVRADPLTSQRTRRTPRRRLARSRGLCTFGCLPLDAPRRGHGTGYPKSYAKLRRRRAAERRPGATKRPLLPVLAQLAQNKRSALGKTTP